MNSSPPSSVNTISFDAIGLEPDKEFTVFDFRKREFWGVYKYSFTIIFKVYAEGISHDHADWAEVQVIP